MNKFNDEYPTLVIDHLYLGNGIHGYNLKILKQFKIRKIVNITINHSGVEKMRAYTEEEKPKFEILFCPIEDHPSKNVAQFFKQSNEFIDRSDLTGFVFEEKHLNAGESVLVHCEQGCVRSPTLVLAFLMYYKRWTLRQSIVHLRNVRPIILPHNSFVRQALELEQQLFGKMSLNIENFADDWGCDVALVHNEEDEKRD